MEDAPKNVGTLLILLKGYQPYPALSTSNGLIHPYYFAAQQAYFDAKKLETHLEFLGLHAIQAPEIRLKPILSRLSPFCQGKNTLHYHPTWGSRFHIQTLMIKEKLEGTIALSSNQLKSPCGSCNRCQQACPTHGITDNGFLRENCLRNWMLSGKPTPDNMREHMGNMLIGCDLCQQVCPLNDKTNVGCRPPEGVPLEMLLPPTKAFARELGDHIGYNLAIPNRLCAQACILAGNSQDIALMPSLQKLTQHPSSLVADHARWAIERLKSFIP